jgi:hypothetical protein
VLLIADYSTFDATFVAQVRDECPSIRIVAGWCGGPGARESVLRAWDVVLSCIPEMVTDLRMQGLEAHHVHHGFDRRILDQLTPRASPPQGFTFVGSVVKRQHFHEERERLLARLVSSTPLQVFADVAEPSPPSTLLRTALRQGRTAFHSIASSRVMPRRMRRGVPAPQPAALHPALYARAQPAVYGLEMFQQLRDSAVTFNAHIDVSPRSASNMRLFEATGVGTCLLTDWKDNLQDLFTADEEVVTYRTAAEALEKFRYLSDHPGTREQIAAAGQRRTLSDHNFERRAEQIDHILRCALHAR